MLLSCYRTLAQKETASKGPQGEISLTRPFCDQARACQDGLCQGRAISPPQKQQEPRSAATSSPWGYWLTPRPRPRLYLSRPSTTIAAGAKGGPTDTIRCIFANAIGSHIGQAAVLGAIGSSVVGPQRPLQSRPNGDTLMIIAIGMDASATLFLRRPLSCRDVSRQPEAFLLRYLE